MRESVFAVLGDLSGASFLDLFSGSGIISLEAASRGASPVEAVESDPLKRKILLDNTALAPVPVRCRFMSAELYIKRARRSFDYIFCDPPFAYGHKKELLLAIETSPLVSPGSLVLIHRPAPERLDRESFNSLGLRETRRYGSSAVDFFTPQRLSSGPAQPG
jgi:16S rRNA (guanine(966)-N(2))-methyltransferase RsmD